MAENLIKIAWSPAFARVLISRDGKVTDQWYHSCPQGQLASHLNHELSKRELVPTRIEIAASVTRRLLSTRLAQSVVQLTTAGFTDWLLIRQNLEDNDFAKKTRRSEALGHEDLIVAVEERVSATGEIVTPLNSEDLQKQLLALKEKGVTKVAINFLHAHRHTMHLRLARELATSLGFEVFAHPRNPQSRDEQSAWRRNLLDAGLFSFFEKVHTDFERLFPQADIHLLHTELGDCLQPQHSMSGLLFSREKMAQDNRRLVLLLEAEDWCWIRPHDITIWQSPWGPLELTHPDFGFFMAQPGREILLNSIGLLDWGHDFGMDPGPCSWGRSHRLTLMDFCDWEPEFEPPLKKTSKASLKKSDLLLSLLKNSRSMIPPEELEQRIFKKIVDTLIFESSLAIAGEKPEIVIKGAMKEFFLPHLKKAAPKDWKWSLE